MISQGAGCIRKIIFRFWPLLAIIVVVPGLFCYFAYNVPNAIESFTFKYLGLPIFAGFMYLGYKFLWDERSNHLISFFTGIIATFMLLAIFSGHVLWVNHLIGKQETIILKGTIVKLDSGTRGRLGKPHIFIKSPGEEETTKIRVSFSDFPSYQIGDYYLQKWQKGSLGIIYRI